MDDVKHSRSRDAAPHAARATRVFACALLALLLSFAPGAHAAEPRLADTGSPLASTVNVSTPSATTVIEPTPAAPTAAPVSAAPALTAASPTTGDERIQPPSTLEAAAREVAARHVAALAGARIAVRSLDPRLRLPVCTRPLVARVAPGTRSPTQLAVEVACPAPNWRRYVGVTIEADAPVVVAARAIARGQPIAAEDLEVVPRPLQTVPGGRFATLDEVVGRLATRAIGPGEAIAPAATRRVPVIRRGQEVTVVAQSAAFAVRARAVALSDAGVSERVRVRNVASGQQFEAVVRSADLVEVLVR